MPVEARQFPSSSFLKDAARAIAAEHRAADLSGITILLPNLQAAPLLGAELREAAGFPFVLLPEMHTFQSLAASEEHTPESCRAARIYLALRARGWFSENDLWRLSRELLELFDELTRWEVSLPHSLQDFSAMLEKAYRARADEAMMFEARLIHELWHALESESRGEAGAYQTRLAQLADRASRPLYVLAPPPLPPAEQSFLSAWSEKAPVRIFSEAIGEFYEGAWPSQQEDRDLKSRAEDFRGKTSPLDHLLLFGAGSLEEEAEAAQIRIRKWLLEGKKSIALIALDRLAARRARALLERAQILVADETGWTFSTTSASTVLVRLLDSVASGFYHEDMLDLLKSPFVFSDWPQDAKREAVHVLEQKIRKNGIVSGLDRYSRSVGDPDALKALELLEAAHRKLSRRSLPLSGWLDALFESLEILGIAGAFQADMAGEELLEGLSRLGKELADEKGRFGFRAWRRWLDMQLESMTFRDREIKSPVVFTHLHATRLRKFDAVVLIGCDAAHLPSEEDPGLFFNQAVRAELKLPLAEEKRRRQLEDLAGLLCRTGEVWASWQSLKNGEPNLLSPFFEQLDAFHGHAFGTDLIDLDFSKSIPGMRLEKRRPPVGATVSPAPSILQHLVPESISASGYNSLLACPYRYYAERILGLAPLEEAEKVLEKADYGSYLHRILYLFHKKHPAVSELADAQDELEKLSDAVFRDAVEADYLSHGWALRWKATIPLYLKWQREREEAGWRVDRIEEDRKLEILLECGKRLDLKGRIDRVDASKAGFSLLDYKTQNPGALREKLQEPGEDVQLAVYALLLGEPVLEASFLSLDGQARQIFPENLPVSENLERLSAIFDRIHSGAGLPAQGLEKVCLTCDMRGLCRKGYWT